MCSYCCLLTHKYRWITSHACYQVCCINTTHISSYPVCVSESERWASSRRLVLIAPLPLRGGGAGWRSLQLHVMEEDSKDRWKTACMWGWKKRRWDGRGRLQNNSIIDTVSAGNKGLLFCVLIKVLYRRPKGKQCARELEPNHSRASKDCHYLT